eukprot:gene112-25216_t
MSPCLNVQDFPPLCAYPTPTIETAGPDADLRQALL